MSAGGIAEIAEQLPAAGRAYIDRVKGREYAESSLKNATAHKTSIGGVYSYCARRFWVPIEIMDGSLRRQTSYACAGLPRLGARRARRAGRLLRHARVRSARGSRGARGTRAGGAVDRLRARGGARSCAAHP